MTFFDRVYKALREVPEGKVTTYKCLAKAVNTKAYRLVGQALKNNPYAPQVPCHRVVLSNGTIGGFMGKTSGKSIDRKIELLSNEGIEVVNGRIQNFTQVLHHFDRSIQPEN